MPQRWRTGYRMFPKYGAVLIVRYTLYKRARKVPLLATTGLLLPRDSWQMLTFSARGLREAYYIRRLFYRALKVAKKHSCLRPRGCILASTATCTAAYIKATSQDHEAHRSPLLLKIHVCLGEDYTSYVGGGRQLMKAASGPLTTRKICFVL